MDLEVEPQETYGKAERAPSERVEVWELPEYYSDTQHAGKSHPGVPRRKVGQINNTNDLAGTVRRLSTGPGAYYAAHLIGRDTVANDVFEVKPKGQSLVIESSSPTRAADAHTKTRDAQPTIYSPPEPSSAQAINATADTIRATKELLREVAPTPNPATSVTRDDVADIVKNAVAEAMAAQDSRLQPPPQKDDPLEFVERVIELQKKLQPEAPPRRDELTAKDHAQLMLIRETGIIPEFMRSMRDVLRAAPEAVAEPGFLDKAFSLVQSALPYVGPIAGPAIGQKLAALVERVDVGALAQKVNSGAQPAQPGGPVAAPDPRVVAFTRVIRRVGADVIDNAPPDAAVAATLQLVATFPDLGPQLEQILNSAPGDLAAFISNQLQDDVRPLAHCNDWLALYQSKLKAAVSASAPMGARESESGDGPLTLDDVLSFIKQSIIENKDSSEAVSAVIQLLAEQPQLAPTIQQLMATANAELVKILSESTRTDLTIVANAQAFMGKLKAGVTKRLRVPVSASGNGHKNVGASAQELVSLK